MKHIVKMIVLVALMMVSAASMAGPHVSVHVGVGGYYGYHGYYHGYYSAPPAVIVVDPVPVVVYTPYPSDQYIRVERVCYDQYGYRQFCGFEWVRRQ